MRAWMFVAPLAAIQVEPAIDDQLRQSALAPRTCCRRLTGAALSTCHAETPRSGCHNSRKAST